MKLTPGLSALVTGGASGIGKALCLALAGKGIFVTVIDLEEERGNEVASLVEKENSKFHSALDFPSALFVKCDVTNSDELHSAFERHVATFGGLDICINNAGIYTFVPFDEDESDGSSTWRRTLDVNVVALVESTQIAIKTMRAAKKPGAIVNLASAAGLYPMELDPIYQCSKGGVVMFTRALAHLKSQGIRINALCPEFIETDLGLKVGPEVINPLGGYIPMEMLIEGAFELITNEDKAGTCIWITNRRGIEYWPTPTEEAKYALPFSASLHIQPKE